MRHTALEWAFAAPIPHAEKLVLCYLANEVSNAWIGAWDRPAMGEALRYKRRSMQRLIKSLRDRGYLADVGDHWYRLAPEAAEIASTSTEAVAELEQQRPTCECHGVVDCPAQHGGRPMTLREVADDEGGLLDRDELERAAELLSGRMIDAADYTVDQLNAFEARFGQLLGRATLGLQDRLDQFLAALGEVAHAAPPPDPVREDPVFKQLVASGTDEAEAYLVVQALLERRAQQGHTPNRDKAPPAQTAPNAPGAAIPSKAYADTAEGRFLRVWDVLHDQAPTPEALADLLPLWQDVEDGENRHTVEGETEAFLLLYPAIVEAARRYRGRAPMRDFLDPKAIAQGRAPWDRDPSPAPAEDAALQAEIQLMLAELEQAHDPRCTVGPRTTEKGDDGVMRTETVVAYYRRVKAKHSEMRKLKAMGVI